MDVTRQSVWMLAGVVELSVVTMPVAIANGSSQDEDDVDPITRAYPDRGHMGDTSEATRLLYNVSSECGYNGGRTLFTNGSCVGSTCAFAVVGCLRYR